MLSHFFLPILFCTVYWHQVNLKTKFKEIIIKGLTKKGPRKCIRSDRILRFNIINTLKASNYLKNVLNEIGFCVLIYNEYFAFQ